MSFLKIKDQNKRDETVKYFLDLKNRIKDNFRKERIGEKETQSDLSKLFKPITETQKATAKEITEQLKPIREGIEGAPPQWAITFPAYPSIKATSEPTDRKDVQYIENTAANALRKFIRMDEADRTFGLNDKDGSFFYWEQNGKN